MANNLFAVKLARKDRCANRNNNRGIAMGFNLHRSRACSAILLVATIFILFVSSPVSASDRSVTFGIPGLPVYSLGYERRLSGSSSCSFTIGSSFDPNNNFSDLGLGMRWYSNHTPLNSSYYGFYIHYTNSPDQDWCVYSVQGVLGYKKLFDDSSTIDGGVAPTFFIDDDGNTAFIIWFVLMFGWSW